SNEISFPSFPSSSQLIEEMSDNASGHAGASQAQRNNGAKNKFLCAARDASYRPSPSRLPRPSVTA
ncbi:MAG: hypothetical protein ACJ754_13400, partial [Pyrinomonadaceae bacterium]